MFSLFYNLFNISSNNAVASRSEKSNLKIINCVNENGDLINTGFLRDESSYKIELSYSEFLWDITVFLNIGIIPYGWAGVTCDSIEFVKYNENMGNCGYDNGIVLKKVDDLKTSSPHYFVNGEEENGYIISFQHRFWDTQPCISPNYNKFNNPPVHKGFCVECNKTTRTNYFRKTLGILNEKIDTTVFKFRIVCKVECWHNQTVFTITYETKRFRFSEDEEGNLVLKKARKVETCRISAVKD
ncbi:hypothetical protein CDIK_1679 [Cucumispora dikerogammari]|nr:hypothetical protein CDIK_1679 [Cucumispora dikerogammari]